MSLNHIYTYWYDRVRTLLLGKIIDSDGGVVTASLASELKYIDRISFFYLIINFCLHAQSKALQQSVEQVYGAGGPGGVSFMQLFHTFLSTQEALGEDFKDTCVRVNPNYLMPFMSDITNEENEEGNSNIGMF